MIDLHAHTTASDGTDSPETLLDWAISLGLCAIAITDHDTMASCDAAASYASSRPIRFLRAIELSTRVLEEPDPALRSAHLLGYFPRSVEPGFPEWVASLRERRRTRNRLLAARLQSLGLDVSLEEAEAHGRNVTGRPHFAMQLCEKGYCRNWEEAFDRYLGERGAAYVEREDPSIEEGLKRIVSAGGIPVLAHPVRTCPDPEIAALRVARWKDAGLAGLEIWHPDHGEAERIRYAGLAESLGLIITGGSDYHGENKPEVQLGYGLRGEVCVPDSVLDQFDR